MPVPAFVSDWYTAVLGLFGLVTRLRLARAVASSGIMAAFAGGPVCRFWRPSFRAASIPDYRRKGRFD